jgi:twitching motility protein PilT
MARIDSFLRLVVEQRASDLHFVAGTRPTIRHNGELVHIPFRNLSDTETRRFLYEILTEEQRTEFEQTMELDFAYTMPGVGRFRTNLFRQSRGLGAVFRIIPERVPEFGELQLPASLHRIAEFRNGLVLFTGPTGSGKTTTQAALINELNERFAYHILTIEDPIEFIHPPRRAVVSQREVGQHVASFSEALRSAPRESPDVLLVGEMRDLETISLALAAAETGVLVFGTLHTNSAASTVDRIVDAFPEEQADQIRGMLSVNIRAVVAQRLVRLSSGVGRVAAVEVMFNNTAVANMIRENKSHQLDGYLQSVDSASGMQSFDRCLMRYVRERLIDFEVAKGYATYPLAFEKAYQEWRGG